MTVITYREEEHGNSICYIKLLFYIIHLRLSQAKMKYTFQSCFSPLYPLRLRQHRVKYFSVTVNWLSHQGQSGHISGV